MSRKTNHSKVIKKTIILTYYEEKNSVAQRLIRLINYPVSLKNSEMSRNDPNITFSRVSAPFIKRHEEVICVLRASENKIDPNITASTERQVAFVLPSRKEDFPLNDPHKKSGLCSFNDGDQESMKEK